MYDLFETKDLQRLYKIFLWIKSLKKISDKRVSIDWFEGFTKCSLSEFKRRCGKENNIVMMCQSFSSYLDEDSFVAVENLFNVDTNCLRYIMVTFRYLLKIKDKEDHQKALFQMHAILPGDVEGAFKELHRNVLITYTLPVFSAECEKKF